MFKRKKKEELPIHTILRLSKKFGAERISREAGVLISEHLISELKNIIREADKLSRHADRKTIMKEDVKLVLERYKK